MGHANVPEFDGYSVIPNEVSVWLTSLGLLRRGKAAPFRLAPAASTPTRKGREYPQPKISVSSSEVLTTQKTHHQHSKRANDYLCHHFFK